LEQLKKIKEYWGIVAGVFTIAASLFLFVHTKLNDVDEILTTLKTTQQMSLKSVIWNDAIPVAERASACDTYLNAGYNSLTKK